MSVGIIYLIFNALWSLLKNEIYPKMDWKSLIGILMPIGFISWAIFLAFLLVYMSKKKLRMINKHNILEEFE